MAERIGKRMGPEPVLLTVHTRKALDKKVIFYQVGELIYRTEFIPADCFDGPFLPKSKAENRKKVHREPIPPRKLPGSYLIELEHEKNGKKKNKRGAKVKGDTLQHPGKKKKKRKRERPPWRS
jgi:hypothetical protein